MVAQFIEITTTQTLLQLRWHLGLCLRNIPFPFGPALCSLNRITVFAQSFSSPGHKFFFGE